MEKESETGSEHALGSCLDQQQQNVNNKTPRSLKHQEAKAPSHLTELYSGKLAHLNGHFFFRAATPRPTSPPRARAAPPTMAMPIKPSETARGFQYSIWWSWLLEHYTGCYDRFTFFCFFLQYTLNQEIGQVHIKKMVWQMHVLKISVVVCSESRNSTLQQVHILKRFFLRFLLQYILNQEIWHYDRCTLNKILFDKCTF